LSFRGILVDAEASSSDNPWQAKQHVTKGNNEVPTLVFDEVHLAQ
jgi:hypothetical protein